jgi:hypothetical protein
MRLPRLPRLKPRITRLLLAGACVSALVGLALIVWSVLDPRPIPVMAAMSVAQGLGVLAFLLYGVVVITHVRDEPPPPPETS